MEPLRRMCEQVVTELKGVQKVSVVLTAHQEGESQSSPVEQKVTENGAAGVAGLAAGIDQIGAIIAIASGKGGVGKSTTAVNLALGLLAHGKSVGIMDADVYGPSIPRMLGIKGKPESSGKVLIPMEAFGLKAMSIGFMIEEDQPMIWRGPMVQSAIQQMMNDVAWGALDVLVVDMPPGTGDAQLSMTQQVPLAGAVIVSTPQDIALIDARKGINMFMKVEVPILGIIENMSYFKCPKCGEPSYIFGKHGARDEAAALAIDFLGEVPLHIDIRVTSDQGTPIVATAEWSEEATPYLEIAGRLAQKLDMGAEAGLKKPPKIVIE